MRNTVPTAYTAVPTCVTVAGGHVRRNQRSRCRNPSGHVHRNVGHDPGITGYVGPEYSVTFPNHRALRLDIAIGIREGAGAKENQRVMAVEVVIARLERAHDSQSKRSEIDI